MWSPFPSTMPKTRVCWSTNCAAASPTSNQPDWRTPHMNPFTFQVPSNILFESGASQKVAELAAEFGAQRILLVTDRGVRDAGLTRAAEDALKAAGHDLVLFEDVVADPPSDVIERAVALCRD